MGEFFKTVGAVVVGVVLVVCTLGGATYWYMRDEKRAKKLARRVNDYANKVMQDN